MALAIAPITAAVLAVAGRASAGGVGGGAISISPGMFGSGITGTCGEFGPRPTTRSCRRHSVYFNEPMS